MSKNVVILPVKYTKLKVYTDVIGIVTFAVKYPPANPIPPTNPLGSLKAGKWILQVFASNSVLYGDEFIEKVKSPIQGAGVSFLQKTL